MIQKMNPKKKFLHLTRKNQLKGEIPDTWYLAASTSSQVSRSLGWSDLHAGPCTIDVGIAHSVGPCELGGFVVYLVGGNLFCLG